MWRGTVLKFSGSGFDPSFSKAEKVRIVGVDQIRQCSRMKRMENGADVESEYHRWLGTEKKPNTTKARIHQSKETYYNTK